MTFLSIYVSSRLLICMFSCPEWWCLIQIQFEVIVSHRYLKAVTFCTGFPFGIICSLHFSAFSWYHLPFRFGTHFKYKNVIHESLFNKLRVFFHFSFILEMKIGKKNSNSIVELSFLVEFKNHSLETYT